MKFLAAFLTLILMSIVLGAGIVLAAHGMGSWLLILSVIAFLAMFIQFGCRAH
jgi:hypothetical protein